MTHLKGDIVIVKEQIKLYRELAIAHGGIYVKQWLAAQKLLKKMEAKEAREKR